MLLGYDTAALANEGFAVYAPQRMRLQAALQAAQHASAHVDDAEPSSPHPWHVITNRSTTLATLRSIGATANTAAEAPQSAHTPAYLGFFSDDTANGDRRESPDAPGTDQL
ncbi:hypothetical protein [Paraburkholderia franconis]|uniref:hypothetical protein n=1 Tax=Paraburkholderia franconis TaxID=2654983 RepID=UPI001D12899F|nr:hypothetical protein [Paraburkholderia franconis]